MRLIDADKLLKDLDSSPFVKYAVDSLIEEQPTVNAIPVEWLKKYAEEHRSSLEEFRYMFMDWRERES